MEGPLLVLKSWLLTTAAIWIYQRWFQRVAPRTPGFEAFCAERPVVAALFGLEGSEQRAVALLAGKLGKRYARIIAQAAIINGAAAKAGITGLVYALAGYRPEVEEVIRITPVNARSWSQRDHASVEAEFAGRGRVDL